MSKFRTQLVVAVALLTAAGLLAGPGSAHADGTLPGSTMVAARPVESTALSDIAEIVPPMDVSAEEAREWVFNAGYSEVSPLTRVINQDGIPEYRGTAVAQGQRYSVIVDSWGNIAGWR